MEESQLRQFTDKARALGMDDARCVVVTELPIDSSLTDYCLECGAYGESALCPPHRGAIDDVPGLLSGYEWAVVFKRDLPVAELQSEEYQEVARQIHVVAAQLEKWARMRGFKAAGLAAGSCKRLFCATSETCQALEPGGVCRFPQWSRLSLSALGVNVFELCDKIGWPIEKITRDSTHQPDAMGVLVGLLLVGKN